MSGNLDNAKNQRFINLDLVNTKVRRFANLIINNI